MSIIWKLSPVYRQDANSPCRDGARALPSFVQKRLCPKQGIWGEKKDLPLKIILQITHPPWTISKLSSSYQHRHSHPATLRRGTFRLAPDIPCGALVPSEVGWGKQSHRADPSRSRYPRSPQAKVLNFHSRTYHCFNSLQIIHMIPAWDHNNQMCTDADINSWFCKITTVFQLWLFVGVFFPRF